MSAIKHLSKLIFEEFHQNKKVQGGFVIKQLKYHLHLKLSGGLFIVDMRDYSSPESFQSAIEHEIEVLKLLGA